MCGDNQRGQGVGADLRTCPSACGGASCDPITAQILDLNDLQSGARSQNNPYGLISDCAGATGCSMSTEGRLKELLRDHLDAQNDLADVLQRSARVDNLITGVRETHKLLS